MKSRLLLGTAVAVGLLVGSAASAQLSSTEQWNGVLGGSDRRDADNRYFDDYNVHVAAGQRVRVTASRGEGSELDPYLELYGPAGGQAIASDDDSAGFPNARAEFVAPSDGVYRVRVRGYSSSSAGLYDLLVEPLAAMQAARALGPINNGTFDTSVPRLNGDGVHYVDYRIALAAGEEILLRLDSDAFDAYLNVYHAGGENGEPLVSDDDGGEGLNSSLTFRAPQAGTYTVRASQLSHADGPYTLRMNRLR